ncbi:MAG: glycerol-3-phosphate 1-O-acyltransferase PlsY [Firmicutes bacterium]|uniref:Glycerol-3-phosphate acyltransferase n=1 Tax=Candidatus Onthovivens merdipullorum TaxID=2840889 RepID=A0A9D9DJ48_9BACL|nr:glycerol-3-phosphate 1-O-acyltransferase PlsY [Candidatus Onthovivens merdipullorum]
MVYFYRLLLVITVAIISYVIGSIPNSVLIGKLFFHKDPRDSGSHNPGGTNAGRVLGKKAGVIVILLDGLKIVVPLYITFFLFTKCTPLMELMGYFENTAYNAFGIGNTLCELVIYVSALFGIIGHCYSIFLKFSGGKAVSCYLGTACCLSYFTFILCGSIFFGSLRVKKYVSLSSLLCSSAFTIFSWVLYLIYAFNFDNSNVLFVLNCFTWFGNGPSICIYFPIVMTLGQIILIIKHIPNIKRLKEGTELKITWMK